ncbi:hypothetical protein EYC98_02495 [Halieaceae bacterium IMCC14734]|uniref:Shikimate kinase n=1 Tax=Candidatus Litorirhabdus singularis TaxID=2518993 RepID=A0ABT3TBT8_9GAMM|nr:hypothetical protein [Candidatus Litorirhabdus singularis]MCX2979728.1 hypothetical protein [Candidatus Litorirhabdus singularis]
MNDRVQTNVVGGLHWFSALKYLIYLLLCINVFVFLMEELAAMEHTFGSGFSGGDLIQMFSATIDTAAWVVLLLLFELETSVIDDARLHGWLKRVLHWVRLICYVFIVYACYGYVLELQALYQVSELTVPACSVLSQDWSILLDLDEYVAMDASNCASLLQPVTRVDGLGSILSSADVLHAARWLAWTDVLNASAWILVVLVLEWDVRLQLKHELQGNLISVSKLVKAVLYTILLFAAVYWGFAGDFIDFWDAFLWLFAFIFIEINVFSWQAETNAAADAIGEPHAT